MSGKKELEKVATDGRYLPSTRAKKAAEVLKKHGISESVDGSLESALQILLKEQKERSETSEDVEELKERLSEATDILSYGKGDWLRNRDTTLSAILRMCIKGTAAQVDPSRSEKKEYKKLIERITDFVN